MSESLTQYGTNFQSKMLTSLITDVKYTKGGNFRYLRDKLLRFR